MTAHKLQDLMLRHTQAVRDLADRYMSDKGNKETECQRACVLNHINDMEMHIRGIDDQDLKPGGRL